MKLFGILIPVVLVSLWLLGPLYAYSIELGDCLILLGVALLGYSVWRNEPIEDDEPPI